MRLDEADALERESMDVAAWFDRLHHTDVVIGIRSQVFSTTLANCAMLSNSPTQQLNLKKIPELYTTSESSMQLISHPIGNVEPIACGSVWPA